MNNPLPPPPFFVFGAIVLFGVVFAIAWMLCYTFTH
jgi:hypothetical protein